MSSPQCKFSYAPDFGSDSYGYYGTYQRTDRDGVPMGDPVVYSYFANSLYGTPSRGMRGNITMDVSNNLEMKLHSKKDSSGYKKVSLIDEIGASLSYNMAAKSRPWSDLGMRLRLKLSKSKTISLNAVLPPMPTSSTRTAMSLSATGQNGVMAGSDVSRA